MADVVQRTERRCRVRTPTPGEDEHARAVPPAAELAARRADEVARHAVRATSAQVDRACGRAEAA